MNKHGKKHGNKHGKKHGIKHGIKHGKKHGKKKLTKRIEHDGGGLFGIFGLSKKEKSEKYVAYKKKINASDTDTENIDTLKELIEEGTTLLSSFKSGDEFNELSTQLLPGMSNKLDSLKLKQSVTEQQEKGMAVDMIAFIQTNPTKEYKDWLQESDYGIQTRGASTRAKGGRWIELWKESKDQVENVISTTPTVTSSTSIKKKRVQKPRRKIKGSKTLKIGGFKTRKKRRYKTRKKRKY